MIMIVRKDLRALRFTAIASHVLIISLAKSSRTILWFAVCVKSVKGILLDGLRTQSPQYYAHALWHGHPLSPSLLHNAV